MSELEACPSCKEVTITEKDYLHLLDIKTAALNAYYGEPITQFNRDENGLADGFTGKYAREQLKAVFSRR